MITIDMNTDLVTIEYDGKRQSYPIGTKEAFSILSRAWLRSGWDTKYVYSFTWMGRPVIQLPEDLLRIQEVIYSVKPDVIIETGVAHGGSLVYYASLLKAMGKGRVIGIDIEIRPHNRKAIEAHELFPYITLLEDNSIEPSVVARVTNLIRTGERVFVILDSCHTKKHVLSELEAYGPLVSSGSYIVAQDGIMGEIGNAPRTGADWSWNNPKQAAMEFVSRHPDFVLEEPLFIFNEGAITERVTYWPCAYIKKR